MRSLLINSTALGLGLLVVVGSASAVPQSPRTPPSAPASAPGTSPSVPGSSTPAAPPSSGAPRSGNPPTSETPAVTPGAGAPSPDEISELPPLPETPGAITEIVAARPFVVTDAWESDWARERPEVSQGWVVVLRAPHAFVFPRQTQEPILLAGARAVERVANVPSANLILAIVPATPRSAAVPGFAAGEGASSPNGDQASVNRPLSELAFWFGTPGLPEQLDLAGIAHEIVLAEQVSIGPRSSDEVARALDRGGEALMIKDREALLRAVEPWARRLGITFPEDVGDEGGANNASGPAGSAPSGR